MLDTQLVAVLSFIEQRLQHLIGGNVYIFVAKKTGHPVEDSKHVPLHARSETSEAKTVD